MRLVSQFFRQLVVGGCAASVSLTLLVIADQGFDASFVSTATAQDASKNERETRKTPALRNNIYCLLYTSPSPRDTMSSRMPSSA